MALTENIRQVQQRIQEAALRAGRDPGEITLVAATKVQTSETIRQAIAGGIRVCGENRVQEFNQHWADGAYEGAEVHFIGHLQKNKIKYLVGKVSLIESVDSEELIRLIGQRAQKELIQLAAALPGVNPRGLMAIPPVSCEPGQNRGFFAAMYQLFIDIKGKSYDNKTNIDCLSMGISGDFEDAIAEGATQVRVGTALFGARPPMRANG